MISANGNHGNLKVTCDAAGCGGTFHGIMPTEVKALRAGNVVVADVDPDYKMSESRVRRQARARGWRREAVDGRLLDLCPKESS